MEISLSWLNDNEVLLPGQCACCGEEFRDFEHRLLLFPSESLRKLKAQYSHFITSENTAKFYTVTNFSAFFL